MRNQVEQLSDFFRFKSVFVEHIFGKRQENDRWHLKKEIK